MADYDIRSGQAQRAGVYVDEGLRAYMLKVYNYMTVALAVTGLASYIMFQLTFDNGQLTQLGQSIFGSPMLFVLMLAPLGLVVYLSARVNKMSVPTAQKVFFAYAALLGVSLAPIFAYYTTSSITHVFFITAATFGSLSIYGYTTKRDLTGLGTFMTMGLFGIIIASIVNLFIADSFLSFIISIIGVIVFAGLTAYDTQKIKHMYSAADGSGTQERKAILGALALYLDFVNMFMMLLHLFGNRE